MQKIGEHVRKVHKVHTSTDTINNFVRSQLRER